MDQVAERRLAGREEELARQREEEEIRLEKEVKRNSENRPQTPFNFIR